MRASWASRETFDFLGYTFGPQRWWKDGHWYMAAKPSKKSVQRVKEKLCKVLQPANQDPWPEVAARLNRLLEGWANYFSYGSRAKAYGIVNDYAVERVRHFLRRRHKVRTRGARRFSHEAVFGRLGLRRLTLRAVAVRP